MTVDEIIATLGLTPHPEGGYFAETWRAAARAGGRSQGSAIYFLLVEGKPSAWHRIDADEIWHHYAGDPAEISVARDGGPATTVTLGGDLAAGQRPQVVVPPDVWQTARTLGRWTLVGCTTTPGFLFDGFELAPSGWSPGASADRKRD